MQILKEVIPTLSRVAIFQVAGTSSHDIWVRKGEAAASILGLELVVVKVADAGDLPGAFRRIAAERVDALVVLRSAFLIRLNQQILAQARKAVLPTMFGHVFEAAAPGGFMAYGANTVELLRGAATYVDKILKGADPAEMPVSQATKFNLTVNLKTAKAFGIKVPPSILLRATKVVE